MVRQKACPMAVGEKLMPSPNGMKRTCMKRFARWFNSLTTSSKALVVTICGTFTLLFYAMIAQLAYRLIRGPAAEQKEPFEFVRIEKADADIKYEKVVISYEMPPSAPHPEEEDDLPAYGKGYTAVATSETKQ
ncbi:hypothetical protein HDU67_000679 [Dinochytrium kinnereticum]|nr:hypothetical protein HDU67_000679 [Dinochytrium kinnereticum]